MITQLLFKGTGKASLSGISPYNDNVSDNNKIFGQGGFTLAETLLATLIFSLLTALAAQCIPVARNAYIRITDRTNAELLAATTLSLIRHRLDLAVDIETVGQRGGGSDSEMRHIVRTYRNGENQRWESLRNEKDLPEYAQYDAGDRNDASIQHGIMLLEHDGTDSPGKASSSIPLVNEQSSAGLFTEMESISYNYADGFFTVNNLAVRKKEKDGTINTITEITSYPIMACNLREN